MLSTCIGSLGKGERRCGKHGPSLGTQKGEKQGRELTDTGACRAPPSCTKHSGIEPSGLGVWPYSCQ